MIELYQAEWCPFSSAVRQRLTELGLVVARPVPPDPEQREDLRRVSGGDEIPTLVAEDGTTVAGEEQIRAWLDERFEPWEHAAEHRKRFVEHRL